MITYLAVWLVFPLLLAALTVGAGLLVERIGGHRLPGAALPGVGFCALVCVTQVVTRPGISGVLAPLAAVLVAAAGYVLSRDRLRAERLERSNLIMPAAVYLIFGAPALLCFEPTFLGYQNLGDAAFHFALVDQIMGHGPSIADLPESSFSVILNGYFTTAYPTGSHTVLGAVRALLGVDVAWAFQPYLSMLAAITALGLKAIVQPSLKRPWLAALVGFVAIQASLVYSYATNEQALKELGTVLCIVTAVALARPLLAARPGWRTGLPLAVAIGGSLGVLNLAIAPWIGPLVLVLFLVLLTRHARHRWRALTAEAVAFAVVAGAFAIPALAKVSTFVAVSNSSLTSTVEYGNLGSPLSFIRAMGAWPSSDFRQPLPVGLDAGYLVVGGFALAAVIGLVAALRRRAWDVLLIGAISLIGFVAVAGRASPWAYGKALMILSPVIVVMAAYGAAAMWRERRYAEGLVVTVVLAIGIVWTNAQTYHNIDAAPHDRLDELAKVDARFRDQGPLVYFEFEEYAKHFLRDTAPTGAVEGYRGGYPISVPDHPARFGFSSDVDDWTATSVLEHYPLVLLRRGPMTSRPPLGYDRVWTGKYYEVWRRAAGARAPLAHLPLGDRYRAIGRPKCEQVKALAGMARRRGGHFAVAARPVADVALVTRSPAPFKWAVDGNDPDTWRALGQGRIETSAKTTAGRFDVDLEASVGRAVTVSVDGKAVGTVQHEMSPRRTTLPVGTVDLTAGTHAITVLQSGGSPDPRAGGGNRLIGPVYLTPAGAKETVRSVPAAQWQSLCGKDADWIEVVR